MTQVSASASIPAIRIAFLDHLDKAGRHRRGEPDLIAGKEEDRTGPMEFERTHRQHHRSAPSPADTARGLDVGREVNMVPTHWPEAVCQNRIEKAVYGAVVEEFRWHLCGPVEDDRDRVALARPNPLSIGRKLETLLVIAFDHAVKSIRAGWHSQPHEGREHRIHLGPSLLIEHEPGGLGPVAKPQGERLGEASILLHLAGAQVHTEEYRRSAPSSPTSAAMVAAISSPPLTEGSIGFA